MSMFSRLMLLVWLTFFQMFIHGLEKEYVTSPGSIIAFSLILIIVGLIFIFSGEGEIL